MFIFGGWNGRTYFNDTISFDLERMVWKKLETVGNLKFSILSFEILNYQKIIQ